MNSPGYAFSSMLLAVLQSTWSFESWQLFLQAFILRHIANPEAPARIVNPS